jgi:uncharacterized protein (DUF2147 family)
MMRRLDYAFHFANPGDAMRINRWVAAALCLSATTLAGIGPRLVAPAFAADPSGTWYTEGQDSQVRIGRCGDALCGALVWLRVPNDPATGRPKTDKENADAAKRERPLLGVEIVRGLKPNGTADQWKGEVYNPKDGNTYTGYFTLTGEQTAELKGCAMGFICKSQTWTRAR